MLTCAVIWLQVFLKCSAHVLYFFKINRAKVTGHQPVVFVLVVMNQLSWCLFMLLMLRDFCVNLITFYEFLFTVSNNKCFSPTLFY